MKKYIITLLILAGCGADVKTPPGVEKTEEVLPPVTTSTTTSTTTTTTRPVVIGPLSCYVNDGVRCTGGNLGLETVTLDLDKMFGATTMMRITGPQVTITDKVCVTVNRVLMRTPPTIHTATICGTIVINRELK